MHFSVYYKIAESLSSPRALGEVLSGENTKAQLDKLKAELMVAKNEEEKKKIMRQITRLERFEKISLSPGETGGNIDKILKGKNSDNYSNSDLLSLRGQGVDIASLTLINAKNPEKEVKSGEIGYGDVFTVNFGSNPSLRDRTGAGDILPPLVKKVKINGVLCERKNKPRPGYYSSDVKPSYRPIYDGYTIEIIGVGNASEEDKKSNITQWKKERIRETLLQGSGPLSDTEEDKSIAEEAKNYQSKIISVGTYSPHLKDNGYTLENAEFRRFAESEGLNPENTEEVLKIMMAIFKHESSGNYNAKGPELASGSHKGTSALGRYQIMPNNWRAWSWEIFSEVVEPTPENQDKIAFYQMMRNYGKHSAHNANPEYYVREMAADWYGRGVISATTNVSFNNNAPSTQKYADNIYASYVKMA